MTTIFYTAFGAQLAYVAVSFFVFGRQRRVIVEQRELIEAQRRYIEAAIHEPPIGGNTYGHNGN